jgi:hypothetical protein
LFCSELVKLMFKEVFIVNFKHSICENGTGHVKMSQVTFS